MSRTKSAPTAQQQPHRSERLRTVLLMVAAGGWLALNLLASWRRAGR